MKTSQLTELIEQESDGQMRNQNLTATAHRRVASTLSTMPLEWLDAGSWRLPSGKALAEFALQAGFLVPLLFRSETFPGESQTPGGGPVPAGAGANFPDKSTVKGGNR